MLLHLWHIQMLGGLRAERGTRALTGFKSQKAAVLLAYLAFYISAPHSREELQTLLWPDADLEAARNRLRVNLSSLRRQLEPPGTTAGEALIADRIFIRLNSRAVTTDAAQFEAALADAQRDTGEAGKIAALIRAVEAYGGDLLPGFYEEWVISERERLRQSLLQALRRLTRHLVHAQDYERALFYARLATRHDVLREESHRDVMRLYIALGQPSAALQQYEDLKRHLLESLDAAPAPSTQQYARQIRDSLGHSASFPAPVLPPPSSVLSLRSRPAPLPPESDGNAPKSDGNAAEQAGSNPRANALPAYLTRFFGREQECAALCGMLAPVANPPASQQGDPDFQQAARLVTLTGLGGSGKTRLALAVAQQLRPAFAARAWFVSLADLADARLIADAIISVLALPRASLADPFAQISAALDGKPALLILDNFEHLAEEGAAFVAALLARAPSLACLVTSRHALGLPGEREFTLSPLPVPAEGEAGNGNGKSEQGVEPALLLECASVRLFVDRAQANLPDFQITRRNAGEVAALCRELEGIPLAIELAAARARVLTPAQMRTHLLRRFDLLVDRRADKNARHRSLRATLEWSYRLLPIPLRRLFAQLSQFAGGWSLAAAQAVCREEEMGGDFAGEGGALALLEALERLQIESLIQTGAAGDEMRFSMLKTLREFAGERLSLEECQTLQARYIRYFVEFAEEARPHLQATQQGMWLERLQLELDNLRAAFELCLADTNGAESGLRMARALERFWSARGLISEGIRFTTRILAHPGAQMPTMLRAKALLTAGTLHFNQDDYDTAFLLHREALTTAQAAQYPSGEAWALDNLGTAELRRGNCPSAQAYFERSLAIHRDENDKAGIAATLSHLGSAAQAQGDYRRAQQQFEASLLLHTELGDRLHVATTLSNLGLLFDLRGEYEAARSHYGQSQAIHRELNNKTGRAVTLMNLGIIAAKVQDYEEASAYFTEAHDLARELGLRRGVALALGNRGSLEEIRGNPDRAGSLYAQCLAIQREIGDRIGVTLTLANIGRIHILRGEYEPGRACLLESLSLARDLKLLTGTVEGLEGFAALSNAQQQFPRAIRLYGAADALRETIQVPLAAILCADREEIYARLRQAAGAAAFAAAWAEGRSISMEEAIASALLAAE